VSNLKFVSALTKGMPRSLLKVFGSLALAASIGATAPTLSFAAARQSSIVIDVKAGKVMSAEDPDGLRYPASLTKMMTLYMVFEALESGRIKLNTRVPVSANAAAEQPSKLGIRKGTTFTVEEGIKALVTRSANDCATAFAEFLGGTEARFGKMMTSKARRLGMNRTVYHNAHGLPDARQVTTARDQARLGVALRRDFPQYYGYFSTRSFQYGRQIIGNHNRLLGNVKGVDGIKTGFTRASGFNLVTSAATDGRSIVAVVMGGATGAQRDAKMRKLVNAYLPKAVRKKQSSDFIAAVPQAEESIETAYAAPEDAAQKLAARAFDLPNDVPVPAARYEVNDSNEVASADGNLVPVTRAKTVKITKATRAEIVPVPKADVGEERVASAPTTKSRNDEPTVDSVTTASTSSGMSGWVIQVGAAPEKKMAMDLLEKVQDKGGKTLRSATPFTVAYVKGQEQLFRARFGGFANQDAAVRACNALKKKGVGCWASLQ
jgi:D-alanyl-D-alanine carboxypeptidase